MEKVFKRVSVRERFFLILGSTFLVILLGLLIFDLTRRGLYSEKMGLNIAIVGEQSVNLLLLRPEEDMVRWVRFPKNIRIKIFNSSAYYPLESVWNYGVQEKNTYETVEKTIGQSMGVIVSRTIKLNDSPLLENVLGRILSLSLKTNLSIRDRFQIRSFLADAVKSKKVLEISIPETVFDEVTDPDGAVYLEFNQTMSLWTKNKFIIEPLLDENPDISINNISGESGAGGVLASQLESAGMHVIELKADNDEELDAEHDCLFFSEKRFEMTERVLREQVGCTRIIKPSFLEEDDDKIRIWIKGGYSSPRRGS